MTSRFLLMHWDYEQSFPVAIFDTLDEAKALAKPAEEVIEFYVGVPCMIRSHNLRNREWVVEEHPNWRDFLPEAKHGRTTKKAPPSRS